MITPIDRRWGAHGWTSHEFYMMVLEELPEPTFRKIRCERCGLLYHINPDWIEDSCARCREVSNDDI